ncbi:hypothetical protein L915_13217 [Phytophthora nicotianae]|uniref:Uncharacterized protein n=1 Tax=Phytophthora nicotianae TaxID=4792 RepID=W2GGA1_PHYNI|nr:hypothetical protein L915_13217 [Phytophthora nicotianae]ETL34709.1 hypothetical protein L916_13103 [Phytophthora nicotianae]
MAATLRAHRKPNGSGSCAIRVVRVNVLPKPPNRHAI